MKLMEHTNKSFPKDKADFFLGHFDTWAKLSAFLVGVIYMCGFLTLNAHLYKYGVVDLGITSSEYLISGSIYILYLVTYGLFGGRGIVLMKDWMGKHINLLKESNAPPIAPLIAFIHSFIELIFLHCLSAAIFATLAFGQYESFGFYAVLSIVFIISYTLDITNFDIKHPFANTIIDLILKAFAVSSFFVLSSSLSLFTVFAAFVMFSFYINMVFDSLERFRVTKDRLIFTVVYSVVFFLGSAITFGAVSYGNVSKKLGGGKSIKMEIGLKEDSLNDLASDLKSPMTGNVVYSSTKNIYIEINEKTFVLPLSSVAWMKFDKQNEKGLIEILGLDRKEKAITKEEPNKANATGAKSRAAD